ncbi:MAG: fused MFS/spermidine synthase [Vicinamibacterales bacterium]
MRILFSLTVLVGAFLLFLVEPMFARMVLPLLGGAPAVWNTCLVFYQFALLAGYLYAHLAGKQPLKRQVLLQAVLLLAAAVMLPIAVRGSAPPASANPIWWVLGLLVMSLGLPFVVLASTGPLLQRWYASLGEHASRTVYSLFAASNIGSFLGLFSYPFLVEPLLRVREQSLVWTAGYALYALLMLACGAAVWRRTPVVAPAPATEAVPPPPRRAHARAADADAEDDRTLDRLRWLGLGAIPSTLLMSVTTFITTDVASVPLLWVVPLALYLLTFVLAFAERRLVGPRLLQWLFANAVIITVALVMAPPEFPFTLTALHLSCFFVIALTCHTALADSRPPAESLTEFYLWLSAGGAAGGIFNALVAPMLFVNPFEYPLAALSACLILPNALSAAATAARSKMREVSAVVGVLLPVAAIAVLVPVVQHYDQRLPDSPFVRFVVIFGPACLFAFMLKRRPLHMGISLAMLLVAGTFVRFDNRVPIHLERSFFGLHRVMFTGQERVMLSGTTNHGAQSIKPQLKCEPLTYYSKEGPVGQLLEYVQKEGSRKRFGVVGLGTASMAAYARPGETWTFFEINPVIERLARDPEYFTYLQDCAPQATVVIGDARLKLIEQPDAAFDIMVLDAFSSDAIPVHLITLEALQLYLRKLGPHGIMAVHISNRYMDLAPMLGSTARAGGLVSVVQTNVPAEYARKVSLEISPSRWVLVARDATDLAPLVQTGLWSTLDDAKGPVWTDDFSNIMSVLRR